jgi:kinesin family protein 3/17
MIQNEKQPNVYIEDPSVINKEAILNPPPDPKARLKSARKMSARRPGSGVKR